MKNILILLLLFSLITGIEANEAIKKNSSEHKSRVVNNANDKEALKDVEQIIKHTKKKELDVNEIYNNKKLLNNEELRSERIRTLKKLSKLILNLNSKLSDLMIIDKEIYHK